MFRKLLKSICNLLTIFFVGSNRKALNKQLSDKTKGRLFRASVVSALLYVVETRGPLGSASNQETYTSPLRFVAQSISRVATALSAPPMVWRGAQRHQGKRDPRLAPTR